MESPLKNKFLKGRIKEKRRRKDDNGGVDRKLTKEEISEIIAQALAKNNENSGSGGPLAVPGIPNL